VSAQHYLALVFRSVTGSRSCGQFYVVSNLMHGPLY